MWEEDGTPAHVVESFPVVSLPINALMPLIKTLINENEILRSHLLSVQFLSSLIGHVIMTLVYEIVLTDEWEEAAYELKRSLEEMCLTEELVRSVQIVGRGAQRSKRIITKDTLEECFTLEDGRKLRYLHVIDGFSNPNAVVNIKSIEFICSSVKSIKSDLSCFDNLSLDLLEMYCGMGNHTVAVAQFVDRMVAVELNKNLCRAAKENLALNGIQNAIILTGDSRHFAERVLRKRVYTSKAGDVYDFKAVLVDPPRCGLDPSTLSMVANYDFIVYISCSPDSLCRDLTQALHSFLKYYFLV